MRVIFLGKHSAGKGGYCRGIDALKYLLQVGCEIVCVVPCDDSLQNFIYKKKLTSKKIEDVGTNILEGKIRDIDFIISYGYTKKIKEPLISSSRWGCINFHPAPLPEWRGMGGVFNFALFEGVKQWGVTAHFIDKSFDTGNIIKSRHFNIDVSSETVTSLVQKSHIQLLILFKEVVESFFSAPP